MIFDPLTTVVIDLIFHHYGCGQVDDICRSSYTSSDCPCYNGDFVKLWYHTARIESSGITGAIITMMIYIGSGVLAFLLLHEYLLHVHRDGRILDLWRRINGPLDEFFMPDDYEVSSNELLHVIEKAKHYKSLFPGNIIKRTVVLEEGIEKDPSDPNFLGKFKRILIYQVESNGNKFIYRHFLMDNTGKIIEVFNDMNKGQNIPKRAFQDILNKGNFDSTAGGGSNEALAIAAGNGSDKENLDANKNNNNNGDGKENEEVDEDFREDLYPQEENYANVKDYEKIKDALRGNNNNNAKNGSAAAGNSGKKGSGEPVDEESDEDELLDNDLEQQLLLGRPSSMKKLK